MFLNNFFYFLLILIITYFGLKIYIKNFSKFKNLIRNEPLFSLQEEDDKTLKGAGTVFSIVFAIFFLVKLNYDDAFKTILPNRWYFFLVGIFFLSFVSFYDDLKKINPITRLIVHFVLIYFSITMLDLNHDYVPLKLMVFIFLVLWIYLMNISNFLDGSDGILSIQSIFFLFGIIIYSSFYAIDSFSFFLAKTFCPIIICFLVFYNKPIAKCYMGDAGSICIGYLIGYIFCEEVISGRWQHVSILYMYPMMDCTITIIKKIKNGHLPWARLSDYFFLIPLKNKKLSKDQFFKIYCYFQFFNFLFLLGFIYLTKFFFLFSIILNIIQLYYYNNFKK